jgi:CRISPR/Cas system CSM-associated protein Csm5 (group 7 of RAMP superfamily)
MDAEGTGRLGYETRRYRGTLRLLSGVHVSGTAPEPAMRYAIDREHKRAYCLRESFLARNLDLGRMTPAQMKTSPFDVAKLPAAPKAREDAVAYELDLTEAAANLGEDVRPFIRDAWGRAYIPGSTLKGAFRQALLFAHLMDDEEYRKSLRERCKGLLDKMRSVTRDNIREIRDWGRRDGKFTGEELERLFRVSDAPQNKGPNFDLLRGLRVGDTEFCASPLTLCKVGITAPMREEMRGRQAMPTVFLERMDSGTVLSFDLVLDVPLLERLGEKTAIKIRDGYDILGALESRNQWVTPLEKAYLKSRGVLDGLWKEAYENPEDGEVILRLGWGCGWMGHSLFPLLAYEEGQIPISPKSRKMGLDARGKPRSLLGYAALSLQEIP